MLEILQWFLIGLTIFVVVMLGQYTETLARRIAELEKKERK